MNIAIIGTGYVGLVSGACLSEMGNKVICVDVDEEKVLKLRQSVLPIYEPRLEDLVKKNTEKKNLLFTTDIQSAIDGVELVFIAVGTPVGEGGEADLQYVLKVAKEIGQNMNETLIVVNKSTVPVGTAEKVKRVILNELQLRAVSIDFSVVSNPEFLKEGDAVNDFMKPDRIVIGADCVGDFEKMKELYSPFFRTHDRFITMDIRSAEMTKYAANAMLATKISFINEMANICEKVGADINNVRIGIGSDSRIGYSFIYPGIGYGGTCFPKDIKALQKTSRENGYTPKLISAVENVNNRQKEFFLRKIISRFGEDLSSFVFAVWGLSFKPETDDMREAPSVYVIEELYKRGAKIRAYDPKAIEQAKSVYLKDLLGIEYGVSKYEVLEGADALILLTEWKEFRSPDFEQIKRFLVSPVIFDGRNQYIKNNLKKKGIEYHRIGKL